MLDNMGAIVETPGEERYRQIAEDYAAATSERKPGGEFKTALVVSPTHREADHVPRPYATRSRKRASSPPESGNLPPCARAISRKRSARIAGNYLPGEVIQFHQNAKGFKRGERVTVSGAPALPASHVTRADGSTALLPFTEAKKFQVYRPQKLALAEGDKLRITRTDLREKHGGGCWEQGQRPAQ